MSCCSCMPRTTTEMRSRPGLRRATNHPGADVEFVVLDGDTISEVQLKAVSSAATIREHLAQYPEIEVVATTEVAEQFQGLATSGNSAMKICPGE